MHILLDRRPALRSILRSLLVTYSTLMSSLLLPPTLNPAKPPEWQRHIDWISNLAMNLMAAANDLRPVQVIYLCYLGKKMLTTFRQEETWSR